MRPIQWQIPKTKLLGSNVPPLREDWTPSNNALRVLAVILQCCLLYVSVDQQLAAMLSYAQEKKVKLNHRFPEKDTFLMKLDSK